MSLQWSEFNVFAPTKSFQPDHLLVAYRSATNLLLCAISYTLSIKYAHYAQYFSRCTFWIIHIIFLKRNILRFCLSVFHRYANHRIRYSIIRGFSCSHKQLGLFILAIPNARTILLMWVWICTTQCQPSSLTSEFYRVLSRHSYLFGTLASTLGFRNTRISRAFNRHTASIPPPHHFFQLPTKARGFLFNHQFGIVKHSYQRVKTYSPKVLVKIFIICIADVTLSPAQASPREFYLSIKTRCLPPPPASPGSCVQPLTSCNYHTLPFPSKVAA